MSLQPAQVLERATPGARRKGRVQVGADADVVLLDLTKVQDNATYRASAEPSTGIRYLVVAGQVVVDSGRMTAVRPGRALSR
jgi:N-acyl-D-glutamate deacylase